jgi:hypothetical protein
MDYPTVPFNARPLLLSSLFFVVATSCRRRGVVEILRSLLLFFQFARQHCLIDQGLEAPLVLFILIRVCDPETLLTNLSPRPQRGC